MLFNLDVLDGYEQLFSIVRKINGKLRICSVCAQYATRMLILCFESLDVVF